MSYEDEKDVLVALFKYKSDVHYAAIEHWYRIPTSTKLVPKMVKNRTIKYIAFWLPKVYESDKWTVKWFAEVKNISIVKGKDLIYKPGHEKAEKKYYKIEFDRLEDLPDPIYSNRGRSILFITTTQRHLKYAKELNDLFYVSPLEEKLWQEFKKAKIDAQRQWEITLKKDQKVIVDFALFCKARNIAIECDGDTYHMKGANVEKDKHRDNLLYKAGWDVRRFTSKKLNDELEQSVGLIRESINKYGGLEKTDNPRDFEYIRSLEEKQFVLFDRH